MPDGHEMTDFDLSEWVGTNIMDDELSPTWDYAESLEMNDESELVISEAASELADKIYPCLEDPYPEKAEWLRELIQEAINKAQNSYIEELEAAVGRYALCWQESLDRLDALKKMCQPLAEIPESKYSQADIMPSVSYELGRKDQASAVLSKMRAMAADKEKK